MHPVVAILVGGIVRETSGTRRRHYGHHLIARNKIRVFHRLLVRFQIFTARNSLSCPLAADRVSRVFIHARADSYFMHAYRSCANRLPAKICRNNEGRCKTAGVLRTLRPRRVVWAESGRVWTHLNFIRVSASLFFPLFSFSIPAGRDVVKIAKRRQRAGVLLFYITTSELSHHKLFANTAECRTRNKSGMKTTQNKHQRNLMFSGLAVKMHAIFLTPGTRKILANIFLNHVWFSTLLGFWDSFYCASAVTLVYTAVVS